MPGNFIDTNVLIYLASGDPVKANWAEEIVAAGGVSFGETRSAHEGSVIGTDHREMV